MEVPPTRYVLTEDGVRIGWTTFGVGPAVLRVANPPFGVVSDSTWSLLPEAMELTAASATWFYYDARGTGRSQREVESVSLDSMVADAEAVLGRMPPGPLGLSAPGELTATQAALELLNRHSSRFSYLILDAPYTSHAASNSRFTNALRVIRDLDWETFTDTLARVLINLDNPKIIQAGGERLRAMVSRDIAMAYWHTMHVDLREAFARVQLPVLVVGWTAGPVPVESSRDVAALIPNAEFQESADPTFVENVRHHAKFIRRQSSRLDADPAAAEPPAFRTLLFTDLEGHTAMMSRLGDAKGREVLREHERITREALAAHGGQEIKTMGDGFMASFGSAQRALDCAVALQRAVAGGIGGEALRIRAGINAGEPIAEDDDLFGSSVIAAARIAGKASGGQVLVSDVVRQLVAGKGFLFSDAGLQELKGLDEPVRLWELRWEGA
ncbi:MAG: adenylate/guanylate cyclase domain-containing protein [Thermoflexaceae bacterium]|nr:adenylate/guanylate cyclase domain-containing protein [Thermoflexaceae bacterium]